MALFGAVLKQEGAGLKPRTKSKQLFLHYDTPFTAVLCGVQVNSLLFLWDDVR